MLKIIKKGIIAFLDHFESYLCQILLLFFVIVLFIQIIARTTFIHSLLLKIGIQLNWTTEIARYAFLWFILFGASYATRLSALNRVTLQFTKFPPVVTTICLLISDIIWLLFSLAMAWYGYLAVRDLIELPYHTPALDWNLSIIYLVFPISFVLMAIRIVQVNIMKFVFHRELVDPDQEALEESKQALGNHQEEV